jgi:hypothetical protein
MTNRLIALTLMLAVAIVEAPIGLTKAQTQAGAITGRVLRPDGSPIGGVRVRALSDPAGSSASGLSGAPEALSIVSLAETDSDGRYRLVDIPAGRYLVVVGALDSLIYFPGVQAQTMATAVVVAAGVTVTDRDIHIPLSAVTSLKNRLNLSVSVEGGGPFPAFGELTFTPTDTTRPPFVVTVRTPARDALLAQSEYGILFPAPPPGEYRISIDTLPSTYFVKAMVSGATDLQKAPLEVTAQDTPLISRRHPSTPQADPVDETGRQTVNTGYCSSKHSHGVTEPLVRRTRRHTATSPQGFGTYSQRQQDKNQQVPAMIRA